MKLLRTLSAFVLSTACLTTILSAGVLSDAVKAKENMEASIPRPLQSKAVEEKLAELEKKTGKKPNIVLIVADDLGFGDPGIYGGGEMIGAATPNIDKMAQEGLKLTSAYSQPTCTPTRAAILTGRLPVRTGLYRPILAGDKIIKNPWSDEISLPTLLGEAGYNTLLVGKWHIGEVEGMRPQDVGFDEFYGYYRAQKEYLQSVDQRRYPSLVLNPDRMKKYIGMGQSQSLVHGFKNGETKDVEVVKSISDMAEGDKKLRDFTLKKIDELAKSDKPFFLEHCFMKPHADNHPSKEFTGKSSSKYQFRDSVVEIDSYVGDIIAALKKNNVLENTLVIFTSDNGPQMDSWPDSGYTPFKGAKNTGWEGGVRIPAVFYWKGMIQEGQSNDGIFDLMDIFNTTLTLAGASDKMPTDRYIDGIDQTSFLLSENGKSSRDKVFIWAQTDLMAVRVQNLKAHFKVLTTDTTMLAIDKATISKVGLAPWLFDLYIDPKEQYPVGHRMSAWLATVAAEAKAHAATFRKYPPKEIGLKQ